MTDLEMARGLSQQLRNEIDALLQRWSKAPAIRMHAAVSLVGALMAEAVEKDPEVFVSVMATFDALREHVFAAALPHVTSGASATRH